MSARAAAPTRSMREAVRALRTSVTTGPRGRAGELALVAAALAAFALLVAPVPPWALDLCLATNLAFAAAVLAAALLAREALDLATFPSLLLFTTLFRLALGVSATRLVLTRGEAGRVIAAFGQVVVGGSYVTGAVVYALLTLAQLLVVAKGSERVAEVAARFALDALPGKQMSLDAELRAGVIDQAEAARRRRALEREGQLHGAMDGALKFVKGDAVAGVAIVLVNVVGGLCAGLLHGLAIEAAARRYALLALGDGLCAQVPALMLSLAAGVVVTRVAAPGAPAGLAGQLRRELLGDPRVPLAVAGLGLALALVPGLPAPPFLAVAALGGGAALRARGRSPDAPSEAPLGGAAAGGLARGAGLGRVVLELAEDLAAARGDGGAWLREVALPALAAEVGGALGLPLAPPLVRPRALESGAWRLLVDDVPAAWGRAPLDEAVALVDPAELLLVGVQARPERDPLTGVPAARLDAEEGRRAAALGPVRGPLERVLAGAAAGLRAEAHQLLGLQEVQSLLEGLEPSHPALVREVSQKLPAAALAEVLRRLLAESVAIRPLARLLEALLLAAPAPPDALAEAGRRALRRQIAQAHARAGALEVVMVDARLEAALRDPAVAEALGALDPRDALVEGVARSVAELESSGVRPVLLASEDVRAAVRALVAVRLPSLPVLAYEELASSQRVRPLARVGAPTPAEPP